MDSNELRKKYLEFFKEKKHAIIPSASLIPENDPTVLFTTAGMHPLKPYLLGEPHPAGKRLANVQKCIRTSDIDEVGDSSHLTFFEMLGNWSLGDYFKKEAISWSYEFLTDPKWLGINPDKISVTVFAGDDEVERDIESFEIWKNLGIPEERIFFLGREDNWWGPADDTGPCGPDTEMFYDTGKDPCGSDCKPGCSCGKYFEIWNDVFMTYNKNTDGSYTKLKQHNVDTGMGIERTVAILNGKGSVYETETFAPIVKAIQNIAKLNNPNKEQTRSIRIIADHIKAATFIMADDKKLAPSNVEQGYIIRRLIRRAVRQANFIGIQEEFLTQLADIVIDIYKDVYPELERNKDFVINELTKEEQKFKKTLHRGLRKFQQILNKKGTITGEDAFLLFTSFGFPVEITKELAEEHGISLDMEEYQKKFGIHRKLSKESTTQKFRSGLADHSQRTTRLHTSTHLLQQALREVLGDSVQQKGSNINSSRTRFDFNFDRKLTDEEIKKVERIVNEQIQKGLEVTREQMTVKEALEKGALGFFQHKYDDQVFVYSIGDFSKEICSGPHVTNTKEIGKFTIKKQKKIGANIIRIHATIED